MKMLLLIAFIYLSILTPLFSFGLVPLPDPGTPPTGISSSTCVAPFGWAKLLCVMIKVADYMKTVSAFLDNGLGYIPRTFPFGGDIVTSEQACTFKFDAWVWIVNPACLIGACFPPIVPVPLPIPVPMNGRAIEVSQPVPSQGKVIVFPWISEVYKNYTEDQPGPLKALGLGFTPFPLDKINDGIGAITIWFPPGIIDTCPDFFVPYPVGTVCVTNFHFDCVASGEKDQNGNDIYKVILKLGTAP